MALKATNKNRKKQAAKINIAQLKGEAMVFGGEYPKNKWFDCSNLFSVLGGIAFLILIGAMFV